MPTMASSVPSTSFPCAGAVCLRSKAITALPFLRRTSKSPETNAPARPLGSPRSARPERRIRIHPRRGRGGVQRRTRRSRPRGNSRLRRLRPGRRPRCRVVPISRRSCPGSAAPLPDSRQGTLVFMLSTLSNSQEATKKRANNFGHRRSYSDQSKEAPILQVSTPQCVDWSPDRSPANVLRSRPRPGHHQFARHSF